jgi:hypothetical protein
MVVDGGLELEEQLTATIDQSTTPIERISIMNKLKWVMRQLERGEYDYLEWMLDSFTPQRLLKGAFSYPGLSAVGNLGTAHHGNSTLPITYAVYVGTVTWLLWWCLRVDFDYNDNYNYNHNHNCHHSHLHNHFHNRIYRTWACTIQRPYQTPILQKPQKLAQSHIILLFSSRLISSPNNPFSWYIAAILVLHVIIHWQHFPPASDSIFASKPPLCSFVFMLVPSFHELCSFARTPTLKLAAPASRTL